MEKKSVVIFGAGRFGGALATELYNNGVEVMAIDENPEMIQNLADKVTTGVIISLRDEEAFEELGLSNFDVAVVAIGSDLEASIIATVAAKDHGIKEIYAKAPTEMYARILKKVGADQIIFPEKEMGERLAHSISGSNLMEYIHFSDEYMIAELKAPKEWENKSLIDINVRDKHNIMILAIRRNDETIVSPKGTDHIKKGDLIIIMGDNEGVKELLKHA